MAKRLVKTSYQQQSFERFKLRARHCRGYHLSQNAKVYMDALLLNSCPGKLDIILHANKISLTDRSNYLLCNFIGNA